MEEVKQQMVNRRTLNVLVMLFSFTLLPFSGIIIHSTHQMAESAPIRHFAMSVHNISAFFFLSTCLIHIIANRKPLIKYLKTKTAEYSNVRKEALIAAAVVFGLVGLFSLHAFHVR